MLLRKQLVELMKVALKKPPVSKGLQFLKKKDKFWSEATLLSSSKASKNEIGRLGTIMISSTSKSRALMLTENTTKGHLLPIHEERLTGVNISTQANPEGLKDKCLIAKEHSTKEEDPFSQTPKDLNYKCDFVMQFVPQKSSIYSCSSVIYPRKLFNFINTHQVMQNRHIFGKKSCGRPKECKKEKRKKKKVCKKKKKTKPKSDPSCKKKSIKETKEIEECEKKTSQNRMNLESEEQRVLVAEARRLADEAAARTKLAQEIDMLEDEETGLEDELLRGDLEKLRVQPRVAIIGGGVAGLSAAAHLVQAGIKNIKIFEATTRLGGRINTCDLGDGTVELGAEWLAGGNVGNPVYLLAANEGLINGIGDLESSDDKLKIFLTSEGGMMPGDLSALALKTFEKIRRDAIKLFTVKQWGPGGTEGHGSLSYYLNTKVEEAVSAFPLEKREPIHRIIITLVNNIRLRWGAELIRMSSDLYGSFKDVPGPQMKVNKGMVNALKPLLDEIPNDKILCNSPVQTILWADKAARVVVVLENGYEYLADYAIVTVPMGYLKENHKEMFCPALPEEKVAAIENIGVGKLTKIYMRYESPIWGKKRTKVNTVWHVRDWADREMLWYKGISYIELKDDLLTCVLAGKEAEEVEEMPLKTTAEELTKVLRKFAGHSYIPMPVDIVTSKWNSDPFYKGAVTYMTTNSQLDDVEMLGKSVPRVGPDSADAPRLYFAGEATAPGQFGSAHGARMSGTREAEKIIQLTLAFQGPPPQPGDVL